MTGMNNKEIIAYIFSTYDFADVLVKKIQNEEETENRQHFFLTLLYIEKIMDVYGRELIVRNAHEIQDASIDPDALLTEAHKRIDALRKHIHTFLDTREFTSTFQESGTAITRNWSV
jgi:hypothetical protein